MAIAAVMDQSLPSLIVALGALCVPGFARMTKANSLRALGHENVTAARAMGDSTSHIVLREVLPNTLIPVTSFAVIVAAEGLLSFWASVSRRPRPTGAR